MYKKRERHKEHMKDFFEQQAAKKFRDLMEDFVKNPDPEVMKRLAGAVSAQQMSSQAPSYMQHVPAQPLGSQEMATQSMPFPSSIASTSNQDHYPVDDIDKPWPCSLLIGYGLRNQHTKQVATGNAIPGRRFHGVEMQDAYCRVEVLTVESGYEDDFIDIPTSEGIEKLGQAIKNFIQWPRRYVRLIDPPTAPSPPVHQASQEAETSQQPASPMHAPASPYIYEPPSSSPIHDMSFLLDELEGPAKNMPEQQTPPAKKDTTPEKEVEQTPPPPPKQNEDEQTPPPPPKHKEAEQTPPQAPASKKAKKFPIPKLVSPYEPKKGKAAGTVLFLKGLGKQRTARVVELESSQNKEAAGQATEAVPPTKEAPSGDVHVEPPSNTPLTLKDIRKPTVDDYVNVPSNYVPGRPMLQWTVLEKGPWTIKRFHDWYMRAVNAGLHAVSVDIPADVFATGKDKSGAFVTFEDMHLLLNYRKLDVQLITIWCL